MRAALAHKQERYQTALAALSAPHLLREALPPLRPPVEPLEKSLTLRELAALALQRRRLPCK